MPCQGMLGLGHGGQRQLRFSKAMRFKFHCLPTPAKHAKLLFTRQTYNVLSTWHWQLLQVKIKKTCRASRLPNHAPCSARAPRIESSFSRPKLSDYFLDPRPDLRTPLAMLQIFCPTIVVGEASRGATFWGPRFGRPSLDKSWPCILGAPRHDLIMHSCSVRSSSSSCILRIGWELWGKNSHRNVWPEYNNKQGGKAGETEGSLVWPHG